MGAGRSEKGGNYMIVQAPDGQPWKLSHLDQPVDQDRIGQVVPRGGVLGIEGMSGAATGYHLHAEIYDDFGGKQGEINRRDNQDPQRFYERFYNSLEAAQPTAAREAEPANTRVDVFHHGLDNVRVEGLEPGARQRAEEALRGFGTAIRGPTSHNGFG